MDPGNRSPALLILRGLPASGKTTWARMKVRDEPWHARVSLDELRMQLHDGQYSSGNEFVIQRAQTALITQLLVCGQTVIVDSTNIQPYKVNQLCDLAYVLRVKEVTLYDFMSPLAECLPRNALRRPPYSVPSPRMEEMALQLLTVRNEEAMRSIRPGLTIVQVHLQEDDVGNQVFSYPPSAR